MAHHGAVVSWTLKEGDDFAAGAYSRAHSLAFDGGAVVAGSSSPSVVPQWSDAAAVDPEIAADRAELDRERRRTLAAALAGLDDGCLRPGLTRSAAVDTLLVVAGPATYEALVEGLGYSLDEFETWLAGTLIAAVLRPDGAQAPRHGTATGVG